MNKTPIEWTDFSSNPIYAVDCESGKRGHHCVKVSAGCAHCYAEKLNMTARFGGTGLAYVAKNTERVEFKLNHAELEAWTRHVKPAKVFVGDMTDIFQEAVPDDFLHGIFHAIEASVLTFQLLTKRPERLARWCEEFKYHLPENIWIGTSVENQATAEERIPHLLRIPAAVRFLSCEPLLGAVDLSGWVTDTGVWKCPNCRYTLQKCYLRASDGAVGPNTEQVREVCPNDGATLRPLSLIDWVIVGGESGTNARPMHPEWARDLRDQCIKAGVPYFFKQWGGTTPKSGGRLLDGQEWSEYPEVSK